MRASRSARVHQSTGRPGFAFWTVAGTLTLFLFGASAPTPLYEVYQRRLHFSATTLTAIFAVYAIAVLCALIPAGTMSDRSGRKPVIALALVLQAGSVALFLVANGIAILFAARVLQGVATGTASGALSAALIDLQPEGGNLGALSASVAPSAGLAAGALGAGALAQLEPSPLHLVFWIELGALALAGLLIALGVPETVSRSPRAGAALQFRPHIPDAARGTFLALAPGVVATWALGGLYLSLGPSLGGAVLHSGSHIVGGLVPATLSATTAVGSIASWGWPGRRAVVLGTLILAGGVAVSLVGIRAGSGVALFAGTAIAGAGFGSAFAGALRALTPLAPPEGRAALVAALYVISYIAFSVPAVAAGLAVTHWGLRDSASGYAVMVIALALAAAAITGRRT